MNTESIIFELPWGSAALAECQPETKQQILLQQHIIESLNSDLAEAEKKQGSYSLVISDIQSSHAAIESDLKERLADAEAKLEKALSEASRLEGELLWNGPSKRALEKLTGEHEALKDVLAATRIESASQLDLVQKECERLRAEVAGIPKLVANKLAAEKARSEKELGASAEAIKAELVAANERNARLSESMAAMNSDNQRLNSDNVHLTRIAKEAIEAAETLTKNVGGIQEQNKELAKQNQHWVEKSAFLAEELDTAKTNMVYLNKMLDDQDIRKVYQSDDGTFVFVASTSSTVSCDSEDERPHGDYPLFMGVRPDGAGHLIWLDQDKKLSYPAIMGDLAVGAGRIGEIEAALLASPTPVFTSKVDAAIEEARNIAQSAHFINYDWSARLDLKKFCDAMYEGDNTKTATNMAEVSDALTAVSQIAAEYRKRQKQKERPSKSSGKKKKGRK